MESVIVESGWQYRNVVWLLNADDVAIVDHELVQSGNKGDSVVFFRVGIAGVGLEKIQFIKGALSFEVLDRI